MSENIPFSEQQSVPADGQLNNLPAAEENSFVSIHGQDYTGQLTPDYAVVEISPDHPSWSCWMAVGNWALSVFLIAVIPAIAIIGYMSTQGVDFTNKEAMLAAALSPSGILANIIAIIPVHLLTILISWLIITRANKDSFRQAVGWNCGGLKIWHAVLMMVVFFASSLVLPMIFENEETHLNMILKSSHAVVYVVIFMATFTAPFVEEVVYRGVLYSAFYRKFGLATAVIVPTVLFSIVHIPQYYPNAISIIVVTVLSLTLTLVRARTKNLLPCIILHTVFNGVQSIIILIQTLMDNPS